MGGLVNIYLVKSTATQKRYVGQTVRTLPERWVQHTYEARTGKWYALHRAMRFHGIGSADHPGVRARFTKTSADARAA